MKSLKRLNSKYDSLLQSGGAAIILVASTPIIEGSRDVEIEETTNKRNDTTTNNVTVERGRRC